MFGIGLPELIIILIVALLVVGPKKLPELAKTIGKALGEFRKVAEDVKDTIEQEANSPGDKEDQPVPGDTDKKSSSGERES